MMKTRLLKTVVFLLGFLCVLHFSHKAVFAAECSMEDFANAMGMSENSGKLTGCTRGNNGIDHCGLYQFRPDLMAKYGLTESSSREEQTAGFMRYMDDKWAELNTPPRNAAQYLGQTDAYGTTITKTGILAAAHLGGVGGASRYLRCSQDQGVSNCPYNPGDGRDQANPACKAARDAGIGVRDRQKQLGLQCGTYLSDYLAKFTGDDNGECGAGTSGSGGSGPQCAPMIESLLRTTMQRSAAVYNDIYTMSYGAPAMPSQVNNSPCKSRELQRISNQFAYAPSMYAADALGQLNGLLGPVSGIVNNFMGADLQAIMKGSQTLGGAAGNMFNNFAQGQLNNMMTSLGLGDSPFAAALCGIMADALLSYIQCEVPINFPPLGKLKGSLNDFLPDGCAGDALRGALYSAAANNDLKPASQHIFFGPEGIFSPKATPTLGEWQTTVTKP